MKTFNDGVLEANAKASQGLDSLAHGAPSRAWRGAVGVAPLCWAVVFRDVDDHRGRSRGRSASMVERMKLLARRRTRPSTSRGWIVATSSARSPRRCRCSRPTPGQSVKVEKEAAEQRAAAEAERARVEAEKARAVEAQSQGDVAARRGLEANRPRRSDDPSRSQFPRRFRQDPRRFQRRGGEAHGNRARRRRRRQRDPFGRAGDHDRPPTISRAAPNSRRPAWRKPPPRSTRSRRP